MLLSVHNKTTKFDSKFTYPLQQKVSIMYISVSAANNSRMRITNIFILDCIIMKDPKTEKSRGFGFVTFKRIYMVRISTVTIKKFFAILILISVKKLQNNT